MTDQAQPTPSPELLRRFTYHPPTPDAVPLFTAIRQKALELAALIESSCPPGRETANAVTHVEEAGFWANAAIARPSTSVPRTLTTERLPAA